MIKTNIKLGVTPEQSEAVQEICFANNIGWKNTGSTLEEDAKYFFISANSMTLTYDYRFFNDQSFEEINPELFIRTNGTCIEPVETPIEECQFTKYGFQKPDFECELLKEFNGKVLGIVYSVDGPKKDAIAFWWDAKTGKTGQSNKYYTNMYNLTPIKKPWYETCKFPCIIMADDCMPVVVKHYEDGYVYDFRDNKYCVKSWRLLTNDEIEGLKQ